MHHHVVLRTARLLLTPVEASDFAAVHQMYSAPEGWDHAPLNRHASEEQTAAMIARIGEGWRRAGLDYWLARERQAGRFVGVGGVKLREDCWALGYRVVHEMWGRGFATELAAAAVEAAGQLNPRLPVVTWILDSNVASVKVVERVGLRDAGLSIDPADGQTRRAFVRRNDELGKADSDDRAG
jgi:RimJ/RimL family protein N-acetyltransferase